MPDNRYYYFKDAKGNRHTVNKAAFDNDREGFAKAFPGARMEVIDRKTGRRGDVDVKDAGRVGDFGAHLFTGQTVGREKYQPKTSLGKAAQSVAQKKWGKEESGAKPSYASLSLSEPLVRKGEAVPVTVGKESELVKGLREADALKRRDEEQMPIDYTKPDAMKQMVGRTHREQQTLEKRMEQAGREAGRNTMKPLREKEARLKTPVVDTGDADINSHVINTQEQADRQLAESGLEFANKHLDDYVSDNILNEFKTATAKGAAAESALSKASPFAYMAAGKAYNEALDPDKLLKHLQEKANADIAKVLSQPKIQEEIGLKAAAYGISPEEYVEKSLIPGLQAKLAADFDKSELSRNMPKSTAEYILRGVNESMLGTIMSMGMTSKKQRQYAQQGMAMTDNGENPDVKPGMGARVARGTLGFVADAPVFGAAGKVGAAVAGKVFGNGVAQTARIANSTLGGRIARIAGSGMVSQGITGVLYGSTNAAVQNYSTGDDTSIGNTVKVMAMGGLSEGASWATMGGIGGVVGAGIYNVSGVKRIPAKAFQLAMEGIGMHMGGNVAKTIEGHDTDWLSVEGNLEACANVVALKLTHARLPKRQEKDGVKESYLDVVARNIKSLMTSDGQRAAFGGYTFTNEEKEQLFGSASAPKRTESLYGYDVHDNPLTRKESLTSWAMRAKKTAAKGKGEESNGKDAELVKTAYDEIMADNTIPWDTKAKFSALVMGTVPSARPMMENCRIEGNSVNEYSKNGELLSKNSFKSIDERNSIIYSLNMKREDQRLSNAYGAAQIKDEKTAQATLEAVAEANGMAAEQLKAAMDKQPLRRSDEEQNACVALRKAYEDEQFVPGTLHAEQSNTEGKDVVEENGLGTETPNNEAASEVLGDLTKTEDALQAAMDGNDVLKEEYERMQKAGMSNPQIYMELFNAGLTQEQLAPLADYINALSKAQGMFKGTRDKIVETTQKHVGQWSYKGELNGEKQNGEQMVFVKDDKGRALIVGAGDVAFDNEGRARESVGDMLSVLDPATMEMDFVSKKDVQLDHTEKTEDYAKNYQTMLEVKNSEVYAEMQQQGGKPNEASLSQTKPGEEPKGEAPKPEGEEIKHSYSLGEKKAGNGESFYQDENGNIDLVTIPDEIFEGIGYTKAPFRLTPSMIKHMLDRHNKELGFKDEGEAINFVVDVMNNFDHVRLGYDGALVFSIENGRKRTGKRAVTVLINSDNGEFYGLKTSGYEGIKGLEKRPLLWERGANETSSTDAASASVTTGKSPISGGQSGSASHQGNGLYDKDSNNSANGNGNNETLTFADGTPVPMMKDSKGRETADYSQMSPEQGAEWMASLFGENAEAAVDGQIKRAEKMLKEAEKIKVDYTGDLNDAKEAEAQKTMAVDAAKKELELYTNIKKAMTEKKVKAGMEKVGSVGSVGEVGEVGSVGVAREKFESGLRVVGNKRTRTLADGTKLKGHYEIVDADSLIPSHNANDGYKKSEGFPVNEEGRTINDRDYENDKQAQLVTDMIAMKYDGQAVDQVPVVTSDGIVVDGNGRTMAGQKAAKDGTDGAYLEALKENAENYGFTAEQIEQSGIKHPRLVLVSDEPMKYDTATFAKFNKNEKKAQGNTQQAVANSKKLSADEIGAIVSEIEGSGSLDAFFNNPSAINSLLTRLVDKGVIGLNEVAGLREGEDKLSAAGKDFVKNLLLGSVFSENTIRMMGADTMLKTKALNGIRAVTDNMKLGDYALMKEIDKAVQLLYEARQGGSGVDAYLRTPAMFGENAADRYDPISQAIALALEGKAEDFRELMMAYNRNAAPYADANQTEMFGERPTKEDFVNEFLKLRNWEDYETRHSSKEGNGDAGSTERNEPQTRGGSEPTEGNGERLGSRGNTGQGENIDAISSKKDSGTHVKNTEGESGNIGLGSTDKGSRNNEGQREVDKAEEEKSDKPHEALLGLTEPTKPEVALRDAVIDRLRENGMDVIADEAEGQRVLGEANGKVREMSFGEAYDYDAYPLGRVEPNLAEKEVAVVEADVNHGFANYKEAKAWAKQHVSKVYNNEESGGKGDVRISNAAIDKFMSQSAIDKSDSKDVHMAVLKVLPEVLKTSIDVETHPDFLKGEDGKRRAENGINKDVLVHRCYGAVSIDGKPYRVKITLKEEVRNKKLPHNTHSYEATKIELLAGQHGDVTMTSPRNSNSSKQIEQRRNMVKPEGDNPNTNNSISAAKLLENVEMSYNPNEKVLNASKKRSDGIRFFRTASGEAYGFTVGGKIYIDPRIATSETPVHEYAHLWAEALRNGNPKEWQNVVELMKDTKVWDEVKARYPELKSDSEIADEVIATYSGRRGAERLRAEERKITESNSGVYEKIKTIGAFEKVKMSLDKFWKCVADFLHIRYTSAEEVADRVMKDLLDGVDPRKMGKTKHVEGEEGKPRLQFIGEKGAAEADHAEEVSVRLDNLSVARDMEAEKKDAKAIKMATGWERGADGKWRYEIADMKEFDRNGNLLYRKHHPDYARYIELQDKELKNLFEDGEELTDKEREEYEALSKKYESDKFGGEKLDNIHTLEAYVDAPELFKAYPELRNVRMTFMDTGGDEIASYHHISSVFGVDKDNVGEIVVNTGKVSVNTRTNEVKSAVLHEMQHAIQDMEGFAMGGNTERMKSDFLEAKAEWAARAYAHELEETAKALGEDYDQLGVERALIKEYEDMDMSDELPDKDTRIKGFNYFARGYADRSLDDAIKRFRLNESTRGDFNPYIEYSRLAGEVEARNVQKRMDMSAEERRASLAAETEDVSREDQIFLTRNGVDKPHWASISLSKPRGGTENAKPLEGRIAETVEKVSKQTGGKVKMVNSVEEIGNDQVRRDIENGKQVTGWYDEKTGEVHLYMPNIHDAYTAEKTVWHETVGHKGMRGLLGDKFNDYMRGLWLDLDNPVNAELRAYVKERMAKDSMGFYDAIEEFFAESAEKGKGEPGFWNNIKNKVTDALHEIGYRISPNVKDVKYMLWLAKNVQKKGDDPWWKMRADAVKWKIEHENVEYTKIHGGEFYENDGKSHDFEDMSREEWDEATDGQIHYRTAPSAATALDRYHTMLNAHGYMATEAFMDNMLSLDKLMRAVDPSIKKIEDVKSSMNPYVLQNTMQGAMSDKMTLFEHQVMKPLDKAMSDVLDSFDGKNTEEKIRECNLYMIGKHGLERNRVLFVRDWFRKMENTEGADTEGLDNLDKVWKGERSDLRRALDSGQIDLREYYRQMDEWIVKNLDKDFKAEEHDYSGMHGLQEIDDLKSPYDDAGAIDSVMNQEAKMGSLKKGSVDNLWKRIKDATDYSIDSDYMNGLMDDIRHDRVKNMFDWYVPLRKYDEATAEDIYGYISGDNGKGFIGETLMNAKGRKSLSDVNVLAQIGAMGNRAIRNGGQNAVKQAFARFVRNSGEQNLVKETKVWVEKTGTDTNGNDIWEEAYPQIPENANAHDIATIVDAFESDMKTKQAKGEAKTLSNSTDIGFKFARAKNKGEHFVDVKIAGRTHRFVVLGNPRAAQALNGMLENSSPNSALLKGLKSTTRFMAQMATSYSPEFVMRNIIRDAEFASSNVTAKEGVMYGLKWARYYAELNPLNVAYNEGAGALKSLKWKDLKEGVGMGLYARYREGTLGDSKMERYFKEFMQNGGETGWVQVKTMQEWEKDYKRDVSRERSKVAKTGKALRDFLVGNVENLNEVAENMARFATFCTSRDLGRSAVRSAYDAKQVSTNFNRHGSGDAIKTFKNGEMGASKEMRRNVYGTIASCLKNYSMFFNAGVQSTHLLMSNVNKAPVGTVASMMAMPFGLGIMAAVLNNAMIASEDEKKRKGVKDPYGELPEYIRRNNLCIYKGGGEFVTIPLAIELRAFYGLGDIAAGMTVAKNVKSTRNAAMDAVGCMSQLLPVVDFMNSATFDKDPGGELLKGVSPTAFVPFVEWWLNSDWKGAPIRREGDYTENRPAWMNAYSGTPEKLMDLNKWVNAKTNDVAPGNENMRGNSLLDEATDPAMLNHIIGTLGGGAATFITRGTGLVLKYADGREQEIETKDIPFLRSLMYTPSEQTSMARTKAKWYGYKESMEKSTSNYSMLKNKNVPLTERIRNAADRHRFEQSADYARIRIIKDAEKQMKRWNKMKRLNADDKKQVDFANKNIEMIMQKAVEQMDKVSD